MHTFCSASRTTADPSSHWMTASALKEREKLPVPRAEQWRGCRNWTLQSLTLPLVGLILVTNTTQPCHFQVRYLKLVLREAPPSSQLTFTHGAEVRQQQCSKRAVPKWPRMPFWWGATTLKVSLKGAEAEALSAACPDVFGGKGWALGQQEGSCGSVHLLLPLGCIPLFLLSPFSSSAPPQLLLLTLFQWLNCSSPGRRGKWARAVWYSGASWVKPWHSNPL